MALQFADRVNQLLTTGNVSDAVPAASDGTGGSPAVPGIPLFVYSTNADGTANGSATAATLAINPAITASQLAAIDPGPPQVSNGIPLALSALATPQQDADKIGGLSFTQFYGNLAARAGTALNTAINEQQVRQSTVAQAQNLRHQQTGVSLDEEAMTMVEFQRAYEANSRLITVLNQITQATINILQS
jgi:flagellar hook-associated protein 1 FlgK